MCCKMRYANHEDLCRGCNGVKVKGEQWSKFEKSRANSQGNREQKATSTTIIKAIAPQLEIEQQTPQNLKGGI